MAYCAWLGCDYGRRKISEGTCIVKRSLFRAPKDPVLFEKWKKVVPKNRREFSVNDRICELHFKKEDVENYFVVKLKDGTVWKSKKDVARLKCNAVPTLFPYLSSNLDQHIENNDEEQNSLLGNKSPTNSPLISNIDIANTQNKSFFEILKTESNTLSLGSQWSQSFTSKFVSFLHWNENCVVEKWIVIAEDLRPKVFLKGVLSDLGKHLVIMRPDVLYQLMKIVESSTICKGATNGEIGCSGYIKPCRFSNYIEYCTYCLVRRRKIERPKCNHGAILLQKKQLLRCASRKILRLQQKVEKLKGKIATTPKPIRKFSKSSQTNWSHIVIKISDVKNRPLLKSNHPPVVKNRPLLN